MTPAAAQNNQTNQAQVPETIPVSKVPEIPTVSVPVTNKDIKTDKPKRFSLAMVKAAFTVAVAMDKLFPDIEPFEFDFKLALSSDGEQKRQDYLSLSAIEQTDSEKLQNLNEVCDLLTSLPRGFEDLQDAGINPGHSFRAYVEATTGTQRDVLDIIVRGACNGYWAMIAPRSFRPQV